jgi:hypothetical protein
VPASNTVLEPVTVTGTNFSIASANGSLIFIDTLGQKWPSTTYPQRIQSSGPTQWIYMMNNNADKGQWTVQLVNGDGQKSNIVPFKVY